MHAAARCGDEAVFRQQCVAILKTNGGSYEDAAVAHSRNSFEPLFASPYHVTREFVASMVQSVVGMKEHLFAKDKSFVPLPDGILFMNRLQFGFYSVLAGRRPRGLPRGRGRALPPVRHPALLV